MPFHTLRTVGMHYVAILGIATEYIGYYLAERFGIESLVNVFDSVVDILF